MALRDKNGYTTKTLDIGDWDMDASVAGTDFVNVAHGLSATEWKTIRRISAVIRNDTDTNYYDINRGNLRSSGTFDAYVESVGSLVIVLANTNGGFFDTTSFNSTSYNRGEVTFDYIAD